MSTVQPSNTATPTQVADCPVCNWPRFEGLTHVCQCIPPPHQVNVITTQNTGLNFWEQK